jgi:hypothetical protein
MSGLLRAEVQLVRDIRRLDLRQWIRSYTKTPTLREVVFAEAHRRTAEALTAWVTDPNPETRTTFVQAIQALEVAQRALRVTEQRRRVA